MEYEEKDPSNGPVRALIVFTTVCLYGMERSVIESFDCTRPEIEPCLLIPGTNRRCNSRLLREIIRLKLPYRFFSDKDDWRIVRPRSTSALINVVAALVRANLDTLRACSTADMLYFPVLTAIYFGFIAAIWFRIRNKPVIYSFHDLGAVPSKRLRMMSICVTDLVHLTQKSYALTSTANPFIKRKRNHVIPPVVNVESRFKQDSPPMLADGSARRLLFVGQIAKRKGVDLLLEAFELLCACSDDVVLDIVGGSDWEYEGDFEKTLMLSKSRNRIRYWGYVEDIGQLLARAYVYVHPTLPSAFKESFGRGAAEAMSAGVPVVCFRSGALDELVIHEMTGLICDKEEPDCLAQALARFLNDPCFRNNCSQHAVAHFNKYYSNQGIRSQWLGLVKTSLST